MHFSSLVYYPLSLGWSLGLQKTEFFLLLVKPTEQNDKNKQAAKTALLWISFPKTLWTKPSVNGKKVFYVVHDLYLFLNTFFHLEILFKQINKPPLIIRALSGKFELNIKFLAGYCIVRGRKGGAGVWLPCALTSIGRLFT